MLFWRQPAVTPNIDVTLFFYCAIIIKNDSMLYFWKHSIQFFFHISPSLLCSTAHDCLKKTQNIWSYWGYGSLVLGWLFLYSAALSLDFVITQFLSVLEAFQAARIWSNLAYVFSFSVWPWCTFSSTIWPLDVSVAQLYLLNHLMRLHCFLCLTFSLWHAHIHRPGVQLSHSSHPPRHLY